MTAGRARRRALYVLGGAVLLLGLPLALLAAVQGPNRYGTMPLLDAVDCDGPLGVAVLAVPALVLYGGGLVLGLRAGGRGGRWVAVLCALVCGAVSMNLVRAGVAEGRQAQACRMMG